MHRDGLVDQDTTGGVERNHAYFSMASPKAKRGPGFNVQEHFPGLLMSKGLNFASLLMHRHLNER